MCKDIYAAWLWAVGYGVIVLYYTPHVHMCIHTCLFEHIAYNCRNVVKHRQFFSNLYVHTCLRYTLYMYMQSLCLCDLVYSYRHCHVGLAKVYYGEK